MCSESPSIIYFRLQTNTLFGSAVLQGEITKAMPLLLPGGIVPSNLPEMLMCVLQMRPWFHDSLIRSKLGLLQSLHPQLLPFPVPARMLV